MQIRLKYWGGTNRTQCLQLAWFLAKRYTCVKLSMHYIVAALCCCPYCCLAMILAQQCLLCSSQRRMVIWVCKVMEFLVECSYQKGVMILIQVLIMTKYALTYDAMTKWDLTYKLHLVINIIMSGIWLLCMLLLVTGFDYFVPNT